MNDPDQSNRIARDIWYSVALAISAILLALVFAVIARGSAADFYAASGGLIAGVGIYRTVEPVYRQGLRNWMRSVLWNGVPADLAIGYDAEGAPFSDQEMRIRLLMDAVNQRVVAPCLIGVGTLVNGLSGFAGS